MSHWLGLRLGLSLWGRAHLPFPTVVPGKGGFKCVCGGPWTPSWLQKALPAAGSNPESGQGSWASLAIPRYFPREALEKGALWRGPWPLSTHPLLC